MNWLIWLLGGAGVAAVASSSSSPSSSSNARGPATMKVNVVLGGDLPQLVKSGASGLWARPGALALYTGLIAVGNGSPLLDQGGGALLSAAMTAYKNGKLDDAAARAIGFELVRAGTVEGYPFNAGAWMYSTPANNTSLLPDGGNYFGLKLALDTAFATLRTAPDRVAQLQGWLASLKHLDCAKVYWGTWSLATLYERNLKYATQGNNGDCTAIFNQLQAIASSDDPAQLEAAIRKGAFLRAINWPGGPPSQGIKTIGDIMALFGKMVAIVIAAAAGGPAGVVGGFAAGVALTKNEIDKAKALLAANCENADYQRMCPSCCLPDYGLAELFSTVPYLGNIPSVAADKHPATNSLDALLGKLGAAGGSQLLKQLPGVDLDKLKGMLSGLDQSGDLGKLGKMLQSGGDGALAALQGLLASASSGAGAASSAKDWLAGLAGQVGGGGGAGAGADAFRSAINQAADALKGLF